jgi:YaiO family outer membrane protein
MKRSAPLVTALAALLLGTSPVLAETHSIAHLDSLLSITPDDAELRLERSRALYRLGRWQDAAAEAALVVAAHPAHADAWAMWADAERVGGDPGTARRVLERGLARTSESPELRARIARLDYQAGRVGDARASMRQALASDPRVEDGVADLALYSPIVAEAGYLHESLTNGDVWISRTLSASLRPRGAWSYALDAEAVRRPIGQDVSMGATVTRQLTTWAIGARLQLAPDAQIVAGDAVSLDATWHHPRWGAEFGLRTLGFTDGRVQIAKAGLTRSTGDWEAGYQLHAVFDAESDVEWTHVAHAAWSRSARSSATLQLFHGAEVIHPAFSNDLRSVSTIGVTLTGRFYLTDRWGFRLGAGYADRQDSYARRLIALGLVRHL